MIVILARDLLFSSRLAGAMDRKSVPTRRVEHPDQLPPAESVRLLLVDWAERGEGWGELIHGWVEQAPVGARPRVVLFGPHTDVEAHRAARRQRLGPMVARSRMLSMLPALLEGDASRPGAAEG